MLWCDEAGNERAQQENFGEAREATVWGTRLTVNQRLYHFHRALVNYLSRLSRQHAPNARPASKFGLFSAIFISSKSHIRSFTVSYHGFREH